MSTGNINTTYKTLLKELDRVNTENTVSVYVPSLKKAVKFKAITVKQQKEIIKSAADPTLMNLSFNVIVNDIIKTNCLEQGLDFKLHDKPSILIALRAHTVSKTYKIDTDDGEVEVDLVKHLRSVKGETVPKEHTKFELSVDNITLECSPPSLTVDTTVSRDALRGLTNKGVDIDDITQFKIIETVGEMYTYELIKYIDNISILPEGEDVPEVIEFTDINTIQKLNIIEALPMTLCTQFIEHISEYKKFEAKILVPVENSTASISIDPAFFATE